ncbi:GntR family transcriptional regulator [Clostridium tarantellae]|uniref:UTRA domain-containing protein n=1 Tax=Clostridium tarantellae TaxID=39493 RepID=A0A6I1MNA2_9CLOT|nr:GntR family transcriptional regulator [Clostridium tarantellae]MPQ44885.1 UTRA domain-containing protein [Clostridium tarantellae]
MKEPKYKQIENYLKELIESKELGEGDLLPSENQLCEMFEVTRMTVRSALNNLVKEGRIVKHKGLGSVVLGCKINDNISVINSFTNEIKQKGFQVKNVLQEFAIMRADEFIAKQLKIKTGDEIWKIVRVRIANDEQISYMITYMPAKLFPDLSKDHCKGSLYEYIQKKCGHKIAVAHRSIEAVIATDKIKDALGLDFYAPLLHIEQITKLESSVIFEYSHTYHYNYNLTLNAVSN